MSESQDIHDLATEIKAANSELRLLVSKIETTDKNSESLLGLEIQAFSAIKDLMISVNALLAYLGEDDEVPEFVPDAPAEDFDLPETHRDPYLEDQMSLQEFLDQQRTRHTFFKKLRVGAFQKFATETGISFEEVEHAFDEGRIQAAVHKRDDGEYDTTITWRS